MYRFVRIWPLFMVPLLFPALMMVSSLLSRPSTYTYHVNTGVTICILIAGCLDKE